MLRYALLAYLCLLVGIQAKLEEHFRTQLHELMDKKHFDHYLISPDTFGDRDTFVVVQARRESEIIKTRREPEILFKLTSFNDTRKTDHKECWINKPINDRLVNWGLTALRRISETKVILTWHYFESNEVYNVTEVIVYDMSHCYEETLTFNLRKIIDDPIVVPGYNAFDIFINDVYACQHQFAKCWMPYNLKQTSRPIKKFFEGFDWSTVKIERLSSGDLVVQGTTENKTHGVSIVDRETMKLRDLMQVSNGPNKVLNVVSSELSFCWITNPGNDTHVKCKQVNEIGQVIFKKVLKFDEPIVVVDVRPIRDGEILLLTKKVNCNEEQDCSDLWATKVTENIEDKKVESLHLFMECTDKDKITIFKAEYNEDMGADDLHYGCKVENGFHFGFKHLYIE